MPPRDAPLLALMEGHKFRRAPRPKALDPLEAKLQTLIVRDVVDPYLRPSWRFTHIASGELRSPATAGKLRGMGVRPGFPDLVFVGSSPRHTGAHWMEVKRNAKESLTDEQAAFERLCMELQLPHVVVWSLDMAVSALMSWDALKVKLSGNKVIYGR
jgi:hypothetical protein